MPRTLLLVAIACSFAAHARAQDGEVVPDPPEDPAPEEAAPEDPAPEEAAPEEAAPEDLADEEPPDELAYGSPVPEQPPPLDDVSDELRYYAPGQAPRIIVNDTEAPRRPDGSNEPTTGSDEAYLPTGNVHHTFALRFGSLGSFDDETPVVRLGALYLIDIRPWPDSVFRMRFGIGITAAISRPLLLTYYARLMPVSIDIGRALVFRFGTDVGLAHLVGVETRLVLGPVFELVLAMLEGHAEVGLQASFPFLVADEVANLWTVGLLLTYSI